MARKKNLKHRCQILTHYLHFKTETFVTQCIWCRRNIYKTKIPAQQFFELLRWRGVIIK